VSPSPARHRGLGDIRWSGTLVTSLVAVAIAVGAVAVEIPSLTSALSTPSWEDDGTDAFATVDVAHQRQAEVNARRFSGRSPFVVPARPKTRPAPRPPRPETRPSEPVRETPKVETGPPATYTGPKVVGVAAELVFFDNGSEVLVGTESDGVAVLAILGPRKVRLGHKGGEYEVDFLAADATKVFEAFRSSSNSDRVLGASPRGHDGARHFVPSVGERVRVTATINGQRRVVEGRVESISGRDGSRSMRIRPDDGGPTRTIIESQLLEIAPADAAASDAGASISDPAEGDATAEADSETAGESETDESDADDDADDDAAPIPPARTEAEYRAMTTAELEAAYPPIAHALERNDLDDATRARLGADLNLIHDLLRPPSPGGG
jgi:hypothetical protein